MAYRILVADDEADIREILRLYLEKEGYEIVEAADGMEAVRRIKEEKIDLALLDIMMPGMAGSGGGRLYHEALCPAGGGGAGEIQSEAVLCAWRRGEPAGRKRAP